ncbi:MAG: ribosome recycling factor [Caldithrix sp. RBG_13_44_9]|nr:MAG: ribosome recycling factor [Caldithrix sp. RBG_13_44_9]
MTVNDIYRDAESRMKKSLEHLHHELTRIRTGRASPALLDVVKVQYYGSPMPLNQVSTVSAPEARMLVVQPWDKGMIGEIEKAILTSDLGLNPTNDGNVVRVPIPELSEERRQDLLKVIRKLCEETRVAMRNVRRDANEHVKAVEKNHEISEDESHKTLDKIQKMTDEYVKKVDELFHAKENEILKG